MTADSIVPQPFSPTRRHALELIGAAGVLFAGAGTRAVANAPTSNAGALPLCVVRPQQTEGPFFVDGTIERSDIRADTIGGVPRPGVPLRLRFNVSGNRGAVCTPVVNARVDVWHCDSAGNYSDTSDRGRKATGSQFLRGYQTTDADGNATFTTVYPGWYPGRAVHVHFKIRTAADPAAAKAVASSHEFTSQLYFDESLSDRVYALPPYAGHRGEPTRNGDDFIFRDGGSRLLLDALPEGQGYAATFALALLI